MKNRRLKKLEKKKQRKEEIEQCLIELKRFAKERHRPDIVDKINNVLNKK